MSQARVQLSVWQEQSAWRKLPRIHEILHGRRAITPETALRLARYFGTSAESWLNLQKSYDLRVARREREADIRKTVQPLRT